MKKVLAEEINKNRRLMNLQEQTLGDLLKSVSDFFGFDDSEEKPEKQVKSIGTDDEFYNEILKGIGAPITPDNMEFLYAWRQSEGGEAKNNPFNTKNSEGKCIQGVKNYQQDMDGIQATIDTLRNGRYDNIINSLKSGKDSMKTAMELKNSPWGTGDLTIKVLKGYQSGASPKPPKIA
jgi:hypothetical protein